MPSKLRLLAALILAATGGLLLVASIALIPHGASPAAVRLGLAALISAAALALLALAGACLSRRGWKNALGLAPGRMGRGRVALVVTGTIGLSHLLDELIRITGLREGSVLESVDAALGSAAGLPLALVILGVGIAPGLGEELFFRGLLLRALAPRVGALSAVVVSALCFGALHLEPVHAAAATVLGLYLGLVALASGSVRAAIVCHIGNNLAAILTASLRPTGWGLLLASAAVGGLGVAAALTAPPPPTGDLLPPAGESPAERAFRRGTGPPN